MNAKFDRIAFITQRFDIPVWCFHQGSPDVAVFQCCSSFVLRGDVICQNRGDILAAGIS